MLYVVSWSVRNEVKTRSSSFCLLRHGPQTVGCSRRLENYGQPRDWRKVNGTEHDALNECETRKSGHEEEEGVSCRIRGICTIKLRGKSASGVCSFQVEFMATRHDRFDTAMASLSRDRTEP